MKISNWYSTRTPWALNVYRGLECRHGHAHVGRIRRDAMFACAEHGEHPIVASNRRAAGTRLALVARHGRVTKVDAASALQEIAGRRRHVAKLRGSSL